MSDGNQFGAPVPGGGSGNYGSSYGGGSGNSGYNGGGYNGGNYNGGYGGGNYGGYGGGNNGQGISVAALVCGILGIIGGWFPVVQYFTLVLSILAVVFGVKGRAASPPGKTGMATAGLVLGIIAVALTIIMIICVICAAQTIYSGLTSGYYGW